MNASEVKKVIDCSIFNPTMRRDAKDFVDAQETRIAELEKVKAAFDEKGLGSGYGEAGRLTWLKILFSSAMVDGGISTAWEADADATSMMFSEVSQLIDELEAALKGTS